MKSRRVIAAGTIAAVVSGCIAGFMVLINPPASDAVTETGTLPQIITLQISPSTITRGESAVLSWKAENALSINIDQNLGDVAPSGQVTITPAYTTTYKFTASNNTGIRTRYITLQVSEPIPYEPSVVGVDPVTGRNASLDLSWEDYCYSSDYQVQVARDPGFTLKVYDSGILQPADSVYPAFSYPPGRLEAGHTYYWRVRSLRAVTGQWAVSPWSEARPVTVKAGFPVRANIYGVEALGPANGSTSQAGTTAAAINTDVNSRNTPAAPADPPLWAIVVIIFGSLLIGMVLALAIREGKKI